MKIKEKIFVSNFEERSDDQNKEFKKFKMEKTTIKLSEHFTLAEMTKTSVKIKNVPNEAQVKNLKRLCGTRVDR